MKNNKKNIINLIITIIFSLSINPLLWLVAFFYNIYLFYKKEKRFLIIKMVFLIIGFLLIFPNISGKKTTNSLLYSIKTCINTLNYEIQNYYKSFNKLPNNEDVFLKYADVYSIPIIEKYKVKFIFERNDYIIIFTNLKGICYIHELKRVKKIYYYSNSNKIILEFYNNKITQLKSITKIFPWYEEILNLSTYEVITAKKVGDFMEDRHNKKLINEK